MNDNLKNFYKKYSASHNAFLSAESKRRVKDRVFQRLSEPAGSELRVSVWEGLRTALLKSYVVAPVALLLFVFGFAFASAGALPGDFLYPVKRTVEKARVLVAPTQQARLELEVDFAEKRLEELERVKSLELALPVVEGPEEGGGPGPVKPQKSEREVKALRETENALNFLTRTKDLLQEKGEEAGAEDLERKIKTIKSKLEPEVGKGTGSIKEKKEKNDNRRPESEIIIRGNIPGL